MKLDIFIDRALRAVALFLFIAIFLVVLAQVFFRYLLNSPLVWSEELARYLFIWLCFTGWVIATRADHHIAIGILRQRLPPLLRRLLHAAIEAGHLLLAALLFWNGYLLLMRNLSVGTVTLFFPFAVVYAIVPAASLLIAASALQRLFEGSRSEAA